MWRDEVRAFSVATHARSWWQLLHDLHEEAHPFMWYAVLPRLTATRAATLQLAVPVLAAIGGVIVLSEAVSLRLVISAVVILGGVGLAISYRKPTRAAKAFSRPSINLR